MRQQQAKMRIVAEWMALPVAQRKLDSQVDAFATKILDKYQFRGAGDRSQRIKNWLLFARPSR
jgi:hypothetical protein